jgi:uncharacterized protein (TIGR00369 family)
MGLNQLHKFREFAISGKWQEMENFFNQSVQVRTLGARIILADPSHPVVELPEIKPEHQGGIGSDAVNGAIIATLSDFALGLLGLRHYKEGMTATAVLTIHYLRPFRTTSIRAVATETQVVGNRIFGTVELYNHKGEVCALAHGALAKGISL